jgi:cyclophilin family peptidyl-prolyl cis-trans isomerase
MVLIQKQYTGRCQRTKKFMPVLTFVCVVVFFALYVDDVGPGHDTLFVRTSHADLKENLSRSNHVKSLNGADISATNSESYYLSLRDLTPDERSPKAGVRHMVNPPQGGKVTLVHCDSTAGPWSIAVHHNWAPLGAQRFLDMVESGHFDHKVPLMRCVKNFLCQFGLNGPAGNPFKPSIADDPNWLPEGKDYRQNEAGIKRFQTGYMAYAGAGPRSRSLQLIVALHPSGPLGGGSPWEVPWGEVVGAHSFDTLSKIYTGYGENGPAQGKLWKEDALEMVERDFPELDHIQSCRVIDEESPS